MVGLVGTRKKTVEQTGTKSVKKELERNDPLL
jgi:hypothetical protein